MCHARPTSLVFFCGMSNSLGLWISKNGFHLKLRLHQLWRSASAILTEAMITWLIFELWLFCYCHFLISCRVSLVLRCFYKSYYSHLCRGENGETFSLAELWPCINKRRVSKNTWRECLSHFTTSNPNGGLELNLENFTLVVVPFRRIKKQTGKARIDRSDSLRFHH